MADQTIGWIQRQRSIQPDKPWIAYYAPNGHRPPVDREVPGRVRRRLRRTPGSHPRAAEGAGNRLCRHRTVALARGAAVVGRAHRQGPDGRCTLDGSLLRRRRAHRPPGRPNRRGGRPDGRTRQHPRRLHRGRQRPDARRRRSGHARHHGRRDRGFAFYVLEGIPTFQYNWLGRERYRITSSQPLPKDASTIRFDFAYDGGGLNSEPTDPAERASQQHRLARETPALWMPPASYLARLRRCRGCGIDGSTPSGLPCARDDGPFGQTMVGERCHAVGRAA